MPQTPYILQGTPENFRPLVLDNSRRGPVLACFCDPEAGPCRLLAPRLVGLAREYGGRFLLAFFDTRRHGRWCREQGIVSVPHMKLFRHEQVVDELRSAESEPALRRFLERHLPPPPAPARLRALEAWRAGERAAAVRQLAQAALERPDDLGILRDLVKRLILEGRHREAWDLLARLPREARARPEVADLHTHLEFIVTADEAGDEAGLLRRIAADPDDLAARRALCARRVVADRYREALEQLAAILARDPAWREGFARRGLRALLGVLGADHPLAAEYAPLLEENAPRSGRP